MNISKIPRVGECEAPSPAGRTNVSLCADAVRVCLENIQEPKFERSFRPNTGAQEESLAVVWERERVRPFVRVSRFHWRHIAVDIGQATVVVHCCTLQLHLLWLWRVGQ